MRGRVMGIYSLSFFGFMPLGSLSVGQIATALSEKSAVMINAGLLFILPVSIWLLVPRIKKLE